MPADPDSADSDSAGLDGAADDLYARPRDEFTAARNAAARIPAGRTTRAQHSRDHTPAHAPPPPSPAIKAQTSLAVIV